MVINSLAGTEKMSGKWTEVALNPLAGTEKMSGKHSGALNPPLAIGKISGNGVIGQQTPIIRIRKPMCQPQPHQHQHKEMMGRVRGTATKDEGGERVALLLHRLLSIQAAHNHGAA
jgi:hypothetical protein